jgi:hypothetical protein
MKRRSISTRLHGSTFQHFIFAAVKEAKLSHTRHAGAKGERSNSSYSFLTSTLDGVSGQRHASPALYPRYHWIGGWVGLRLGMDTEARGKSFS